MENNAKYLPHIQRLEYLKLGSNISIHYLLNIHKKLIPVCMMNLYLFYCTTYVMYYIYHISREYSFKCT